MSNSKYIELLSTVAKLSKMFSESSKPAINYRTHENIFCLSFNAKNLSRSDISFDAKISENGYGLKTFVYSGKPKFEKVAEFNKLSESINLISDTTDKAKKIIEYRNERVKKSCNIAEVSSAVYHCLLRDNYKLLVHEEDMIIEEEFIDCSCNGTSLEIITKDSTYRYNYSKSTLFKKFECDNIVLENEIEILNDPFELLTTIDFEKLTVEDNNVDNYIILPLYSTQNGKVPERSQLNQWNAKGRPRNENEVYIPIPAQIRSIKPEFFPPRNTCFDLILPSGKVLNSKICQDNNKALMSNPNKDLGKWLLRDVFELEVRELLTKEHLEIAGIDSVMVTKIDDTYYIDFTEIGSYEKYIEENGAV